MVMDMNTQILGRNNWKICGHKRRMEKLSGISINEV